MSDLSKPVMTIEEMWYIHGHKASNHNKPSSLSMSIRDPQKSDAKLNMNQSINKTVRKLTVVLNYPSLKSNEKERKYTADK
jgi:hypothetical protein